MSGRRRPVGELPLPAETDLVIVDGNNLLHRARGTGDEAGVRWLLPRLRAWRPAEVRILLVLDGHPEPGEARRRKVVTGIESVYSLSETADAQILRTIAVRSYGERIATALVTDDRALADKARALGASVRRLEWFLDRMAAAAGSPDIGRPRTVAAASAAPAAPRVQLGAGRPPRGSAAGRSADAPPAGEDDRTPWKPGRGATRKVGNPRRGHPPA